MAQPINGYTNMIDYDYAFDTTLTNPTDGSRLECRVFYSQDNGNACKAEYDTNTHAETGTTAVSVICDETEKEMLPAIDANYRNLCDLYVEIEKHWDGVCDAINDEWHADQYG